MPRPTARAELRAIDRLHQRFRVGDGTPPVVHLHIGLESSESVRVASIGRKAGVRCHHLEFDLDASRLRRLLDYLLNVWRDRVGGGLELHRQGPAALGAHAIRTRFPASVVEQPGGLDGVERRVCVGAALAFWRVDEIGGGHTLPTPTQRGVSERAMDRPDRPHAAATALQARRAACGPAAPSAQGYLRRPASSSNTRWSHAATADVRTGMCRMAWSPRCAGARTLRRAPHAGSEPRRLRPVAFGNNSLVTPRGLAKHRPGSRA